MKGVILAGGLGTRLSSLTVVVNKHLLPVGKHPMIYYGIQKLRAAGIKEIVLVAGRHSVGSFASYLGSGRQLGVSITYKIQEEAGGIAQALALAEGFIGNNEKFVVQLGDNLYEDNLKDEVNRFLMQDQEAMVFLKEVQDPHRYGVPIFKGESIIFIEEKPSTPKSNFCVTGIYMYDSSVFEVIRKMKPSSRGELEITDVNNDYAIRGELCYKVLDGWWTDAGTFESLYEAGNRMLKHDGDPI